MRYVTIRVTPTEGAALHPIGQALADEPSITREAIHRVEILPDGTGILLSEASGDQDRYEAILDESDYVHEYAVTGADGRWYAYLQFEPTPLSKRMVEFHQSTPVAVETPIPAAEDGSMEITLVGDDEAFADTAFPDSDAYDIELLETGERPPRGEDVFATLTRRQRAILEVAVDLGYYENPRQATQADVAERVDATPSTVGEHLRKIESRVFGEFA